MQRGTSEKRALEEVGDRSQHTKRRKMKSAAVTLILIRQPSRSEIKPSQVTHGLNLDPTIACEIARILNHTITDQTVKL